SSMDENTILERLAKRLVPEFADWLAVFRPLRDTDHAGLELTMLFPSDQPFPSNKPLIRSPEDPITKAFDRGTLIVIERLSADRDSIDKSHRDFWGSLEMQSALFLPLCGPRNVSGVL